MVVNEAKWKWKLEGVFGTHESSKASGSRKDFSPIQNYRDMQRHKTSALRKN